MSERTALEIADLFDELSSIMRIHNVPTLPKLHDYGKKATDMLRSQQHAEIERLTALNSALTAKSNAFVIENARQAEEIERLTAERDAAIASAVIAERNDTIEQLRKWAVELGFEGSWRWKTPGGLLYRAAEMVSDRTKPRASIDSGHGTAIAAAVAAEREACAAMCRRRSESAGLYGSASAGALQCERDIRARSST